MHSWMSDPSAVLGSYKKLAEISPDNRLLSYVDVSSDSLALTAAGSSSIHSGDKLAAYETMLLCEIRRIENSKTPRLSKVITDPVELAA